MGAMRLVYVCLVMFCLMLISGYVFHAVPSEEAVSAWGIVLCSEGYFMGGCLDNGSLYVCGYFRNYTGGKYTPKIFVAKYDIVEEKLLWLKVIEEFRGWAYSILVVNGRVFVSGFVAPSEGFIVCLDSSGSFLWGYLVECPLYGLLSFEDKVLAYGRGLFILFSRDGEVIKAVFVEVKNAAGGWVPVDAWGAQYIDGKIYAVGYQARLLSAEKKFGRVFDGHLICLSKDLEVIWAVGFGSREHNEYFRGICVDHGSLYVCGFYQIYAEDKVVDQNIVVVEFNTNGSIKWAKSIDCSVHDYASAVKVIHENIYVVGNSIGSFTAESSDFIIVKICKKNETSCFWTIGGNLSEFCWGAFFAENGILIYGETSTWAEKSASSKIKGYPIAVYWPLNSVGEIFWGKSGWESIKVKKHVSSKVIFLNFTVSKLLTRSRGIKYCKKYMFKLADQKVLAVSAKGNLTAVSLQKKVEGQTSSQSAKEKEAAGKGKVSGGAKASGEEITVNVTLGALFLVAFITAVVAALVLIVVVVYYFVKRRKRRSSI